MGWWVQPPSSIPFIHGAFGALWTLKFHLLKVEQKRRYHRKKWQKVSKIPPSNKNLQSSGVWLQSHLNSGFVGSGLMWSDHAKSKIFCCKYFRAKVENPVEKRLVLRRWGSGRDRREHARQNTGILNSMTSLNNQLTNSYQFYHPSPDLLTSFPSTRDFIPGTTRMGTTFAQLWAPWTWLRGLWRWRRIKGCCCAPILEKTNGRTRDFAGFGSKM